MSVLICPVCGKPLSGNEKSFLCPDGHLFDRAKEGYVNLNLRPSTALSGDTKESLSARRSFLEKGFYGFLAEKVASLVYGVCIDCCCGEGYYTGIISEKAEKTYAFDLSKEGVKAASKKYKNVTFFTANISSVPVADCSADTLLHICAPVHIPEFSRILKKGGIFIDVIPSERHLFGVKEILYDSPYENDGHSEAVSGFTEKEKIRVTDRVYLGKEDIKNLITMTPYAFRTPKEKLEKIFSLGGVETEVGFIIRIFSKN